MKSLLLSTFVVLSIVFTSCGSLIVEPTASFCINQKDTTNEGFVSAVDLSVSPLETDKEYIVFVTLVGSDKVSHVYAERKMGSELSNVSIGVQGEVSNVEIDKARSRVFQISN